MLVAETLRNSYVSMALLQLRLMPAVILFTERDALKAV